RHHAPTAICSSRPATICVVAVSACGLSTVSLTTAAASSAALCAPSPDLALPLSFAHLSCFSRHPRSAPGAGTAGVHAGPRRRWPPPPTLYPRLQLSAIVSAYSSLYITHAVKNQGGGREEDGPWNRVDPGSSRSADTRSSRRPRSTGRAGVERCGSGFSRR